MTRLAALIGRLFAAYCVAGALLLGGCATLPGSEASRSPRDPFESYNRAMDSFNQALDDAVVAPAARAYRDAFPEEMRALVGNFFANLWDLPSAGHQLLQGKPERASYGLPERATLPRDEQGAVEAMLGDGRLAEAELLELGVDQGDEAVTAVAGALGRDQRALPQRDRREGCLGIDAPGEGKG